MSDFMLSLFLAFQCQDGEDLLHAVDWSHLQHVKEILRRSPKCIQYMGKDSSTEIKLKCKHGNTITQR